MTKRPNDLLSDTKLLMGALVRMKPKPHEELKGKKPRAVKKPTKQEKK